MSKELTIFKYDEKEVRTIMDGEGNPWWVAIDVCNVLELTDVSKSIMRLDDDEKLIRKLFVSGQNRDMWIISEAGLYSLIIRSNKSKAKPFQRWITHDVLPSIRKTGNYSLAPLSRIEMLEQLLELERKTEENKPKVEYYEKVSDAVNLHSMNGAAKILNWGRNLFMKRLREDKILFKSDGGNIPYQRYIDAGYFEVKERVYGDGIQFLAYTTYVTGKGIQWMFKKYGI